MKKSFYETAFGIGIAAALFVSGVVCAYIFRAPVPTDWWSPVAALSTTGAVFVALWTTNRQSADTIKREVDADAAILLGFQQLSKELTRACFLAGYQTDSEENETLYADISAEFAEIAKMLSDLPMEILAKHGQIPRCMHLRRIANESCLLWKGVTKRDGSFYMNNRTKLTDLERRARKENIAIAEYLEKLSPTLYQRHKDLIEKM
ncbi:hypothetical protein [Herminiimonas contaminans]|uniref:DUF4760 domain-containing protein n=1 Tax=Herminiimonas contaminans TaxID=1111140 RepID=A0ABS0EQT1_9BURK|nr:hypothetical protein [Herminiimonas contaminans]MBF8177216.1 hypothetical protein [Herminiimonas contaminans]